MDALELKLTGSVLKLAQNFRQRWDKDHSLTYVIEDAIVAGLEAKRRSKEYSEKNQNQKKFEKEIATDPQIILHPDKMLTLMKKYGFGASNTKLEEQVLEAATKATEPASTTEPVKTAESAA